METKCWFDGGNCVSGVESLSATAGYCANCFRVGMDQLKETLEVVFPDLIGEMENSVQQENDQEVKDSFESGKEEGRQNLIKEMVTDFQSFLDRLPVSEKKLEPKEQEPPSQKPEQKQQKINF